MTRYFIFLSFRGTGYSGWQVQPKKETVQGVLNMALSTLLGEEINVTGAGRTDAGVHATFFCAHFDTGRADLDSDRRFLYRINSFLPHDIAVMRFVRVKSDANARFDALSRTYRYTIITEKDPFRAGTAWLVHPEPDLDRLNQASAVLLKYSDFASFCKLHGGNKTTLCKVMNAFWVKEPGRLVFTIKADRFLRNMVRAITGTLVRVGSGKITTEEFEAVIKGLDRGLAGQSAPAHGLALTDIEYPDSVFIQPVHSTSPRPVQPE